MTSKERMNIVLAGGKADRVPIALILDDTYLCRAAGADLRELHHGNSASRADLQRRLMKRHPLNDILICWDGTNRNPVSKLERQGDRFFDVNVVTGEQREISDPAERTLADEPMTSEISVADPITSIEDIDRKMDPILSVDDVVASGWFDVLEQLRREFGDTKFITYRPGELFPPAVELLGGFETAMRLVIEQPDLVHAVIIALAKRKVPYIEASARFAPDGVLLTAFLEGTDMIAPNAWRQLVMPGHRLMADAARKQRQKTLFWFLGGCIELLEDFVNLSINALVVETSRCAYSCEPAEIRNVLGNRMCVFGWTPEYAIVSGNRKEITRVVEEQINSSSLGGGFVMGTTFLTSHTAPETVDFFCEEVVRLTN